MSVPTDLTEAAAWQIVWDDQKCDFVFKPLSSGTPFPSAAASGSAPDNVINFSLDAMVQMVEESREKAREEARYAGMHQHITQYLHEIKSLQWPPKLAQHDALYDLQNKISLQHPIRICPDRDDKRIPEQRSIVVSSDEDKKHTESRNKEQPYLAISTAFEWKVRSADFFLYHPEARKATLCPDGYPVLHTLSDFFELLKTKPTGKEAKKKKKRQVVANKKGEGQAATATTISGNMGDGNQGRGTNNTSISARKVPELVYIIGRLVICQPHADESSRDLVQPTVFVVAVELNKNSNNDSSTGNNNSGSGSPVWLIHDKHPTSLDEDSWELHNAELSMRRLSAIWPAMEGQQPFGAARLAGSIEGLLGEACMPLSEAGANVWNSMSLGSWAMVGVQGNQVWP
ncbi:hypothetical protein UCDDA912_g10603 [Diaporthe ampelina]|uniref:Uncharacterized protein n=1 Tax=Diaporthe ampelina TaxID=1214573 RepID=A0A0G2HMI8_9PEZI|nr:hypothetical protein UCDDA912_g10603 [Diaporthe ampelina]